MRRRKKKVKLERDAPVKVHDPALLAHARTAADGNPRLMELLHQVLVQPDLDHARIVKEVQEIEEGFREGILARELIDTLSDEDRSLLGRLLLCALPIPLEAVQAVDPARTPEAVRQALAQASDLTLVDITMEDGKPHYRVPHQLSGSEPPLLPTPDDAERSTHVGRVFDVLYRTWLAQANAVPEHKILELIRLAAECGKGASLCCWPA